MGEQIRLLFETVNRLTRCARQCVHYVLVQVYITSGLCTSYHVILVKHKVIHFFVEHIIGHICQ